MGYGFCLYQKIRFFFKMTVPFSIIKIFYTFFILRKNNLSRDTSTFPSITKICSFSKLNNLSSTIQNVIAIDEKFHFFNSKAQDGFSIPFHFFIIHVDGKKSTERSFRNLHKNPKEIAFRKLQDLLSAHKGKESSLTSLNPIVYWKFLSLRKYD